eukprot:m.362684 g.362684  ORF g.362684 m.362684 type:complete len:331 (+) comp20750_c0_seq1:133-1125(+)
MADVSFALKEQKKLGANLLRDEESDEEEYDELGARAEQGAKRRGLMTKKEYIGDANDLKKKQKQPEEELVIAVGANQMGETVTEAEDATDDAYASVPVEAFGAALLRGMGWKTGEAIGLTNKGIVEPIIAKARPKGLGLGAIRQDLKGTQEASAAPLTSTSAADSSRRDGGGQRASEQRSEQKRSSRDSRPPAVSAASSSSSKRSKYTSERVKVWLRPDIRVRIVSKSYKDGRYYKHKVRVADVPSADDVVCTDDRGRMLDGLKQRQLETVIPKEMNSTVMIVSGKYSGTRAKLIAKDDRKEKATVLIEETIAEELSFDDVCEYLGPSLE